MTAKKISLFEIAKTFLIIGTTGFGGGLAIISLTQEYCVNRKKWLTSDEFSHGVALGQFMGPFAVNTAIFVGYRTRGFLGGLTALVAFLLPSIVAVIALSAVYLKYNKVTYLQQAFKNISPVVIALILSAAWSMGKDKIKNYESIFLIIATIILFLVFKIQVFSMIMLAIIYGYVKVVFFERGT